MHERDEHAEAAVASGRRGLASLVAACALCGAVPAAAQPSGADVMADLRHVALDLRLDWARRQLMGVATLTLQTRQAGRRLQLQAAELDVASVHDGDGRALAHRAEGAGDAGRLHVELGHDRPTGTPLTLRITYRSRHAQGADPNALWGSSGVGLRWFEPTGADPRKRRQVWASGEPGSQHWWLPLPVLSTAGPVPRFSSEIALTVERSLVAVASGEPQAVQSLPDGLRRYRYRSAAGHTAQRLGFVVGEFVEIPQRADDLQLMSWSYPDEAAATAASVERLPQTLQFMAQLAGQPLPQRHFAQVFVQDHPWGHAAQALAVQSETMVDDCGVHADFLYLWDLLQAETLANQWFGGLVSACDGRHTWLERGIARYAAALFNGHVHGAAELSLYALAADQAAARGETPPLVPAQLDDPRAFAAGLTPTARGSAVLHLLRHEIGHEAFVRSLQRYLRDNAGRPACTAALQQAVQAEAGRDLGWFFQQWVYGAGHPRFEVDSRWDPAAGRLTVEVAQPALSAAASPTQGGATPFQGHVEIDLGGTVHRVWLAPQALNRFDFPLAQPPRWLQLDPGGAWLMEQVQAQPLATLLEQLRRTPHAMGRQWAGQQVAARWKAATAAERAEIIDALRDVAGTPGRWWRERFIVLNQLRTLLAPTRPDGAAVLGDALRRTLLDVVRDEGSWLRATALRLLGDSRDPAHADLYLAHLADPSDRVINAAAIALGRTGDPRAFAALARLPAHPSWKNQSLISALAGLGETRDPRAGDIAMAALGDVASPRWTLATPVWDYPLAAAGTLAALAQGARAVPMLQARLQVALDGGRDSGDVIYVAGLLAALGDPAAQPLLAQLRQRLAADVQAVKAVQAYEAQLAQALADRR
ncbi:MAG: M1 family aminopeptidase [Aquabacterium sp.]